jgi:hypothetical protein
VIPKSSSPHMRAAKIGDVRDLLLACGSQRFFDLVRAADDKEVVVLASATCAGFLAYLLDSVTELRGVIEKWRREPAQAQ